MKKRKNTYFGHMIRSNNIAAYEVSSGELASLVNSKINAT